MDETLARRAFERCLAYNSDMRFPSDSCPVPSSPDDPSRPPCAGRAPVDPFAQDVDFAIAKKAAGCLDDHDAGLVRLPPAMHALAIRNIRVFLFAHLHSEDARMLAACSWAASDLYEKILEESDTLLQDPS